MKYGVLFSTLSVLLAILAFRSGGWFLLLLWPAVSFALLGSGYLKLGHCVFGKHPAGMMNKLSVIVLLPYLIYLGLGWHLLRVLLREPAHDTLVDGVLIGRRLLSSELPADTKTVVDLTSEFVEPVALRSVLNYIAAPMLDASAWDPRDLADLALRIADAETPIFIHCAQGHGRTGLVAALVLIAGGEADDAATALAKVQSVRPLVGLNRVQSAALLEASQILKSDES